MFWLLQVYGISLAFILLFEAHRLIIQYTHLCYLPAKAVTAPLLTVVKVIVEPQASVLIHVDCFHINNSWSQCQKFYQNINLACTLSFPTIIKISIYALATEMFRLRTFEPKECPRAYPRMQQYSIFQVNIAKHGGLVHTYVAWIYMMLTVR